MNKKLIALLTASLLLVAATATACQNGGQEENTDDSGAPATGDYIIVGTDAEGNDITAPATAAPEDPAVDPSESNPTFVDVTKQVVVFTAVATVRSSTVVADNNAIGWPSEGKLLDVTGESTNWYRINYTLEGETVVAYIAKTVAADASVLDAFTAIEGEGELVEITVTAANIRSYPSTDSTNSIRISAKKGAQFTRVAISENWSRILYEEVSETETDAEGNPVKTIKQYYISNDCLKVVAAAETTAAAE